MSKLGMATVGGGTEGGVTVRGVAASTSGDGAGAPGEVAAALAAWPRMAGSPGSPRQASPRTAAVTTAPAAISQMRRPTSVATSLCASTVRHPRRADQDRRLLRRCASILRHDGRYRRWRAW